MADDRRTRRTRRVLHEALISLILEKGYERVTVQELLDRADIVRSTFYAHYRDKDALLLSCFEDILAELRAAVETMAPGMPANPARPAQILYEHAYRNQSVYRALCGRQGGSVVRRYLHRLVADLLRDRLHPYLPTTELPAELVAEFYTSATLGLLFWWVDQDFPHDPAWLAGACQVLAAPGILAAVGQGQPVH